MDHIGKAMERRAEQVKSLVDSPLQASMSIKHFDVCHQLVQEKTQPRATPFSCGDTHSP